MDQHKFACLRADSQLWGGKVKSARFVAAVTATATLGAMAVSAPAAANSTEAQRDRAVTAVSRTPEAAETTGPVQAPATLGDGVSIATANTGITVHTGDTKSADRTVVGNRAVYLGSEKQTSTILQLTSGATQIIKVIDGASAPTSYTFHFDLPEDMRLASTSAGGVVIEQRSTVVGYVEAPWAVDATGTRVPTSYRVDGNTIIQTVSHKGATYPVVADPSITVGRYFYVRYSKSEVQRSNTTLVQVGNSAMITLMCGWVTALHAGLGAVCGAALAQYSSSITGQVRDAARANQCILHRYTIVAVRLVAWERYNC